MASAVVPTTVAVCPAIQPFQPALTTPSPGCTILPAASLIPRFCTHCSPISLIASVPGAIIALANAFFRKFGLIGPPYIILFCTVSNTPPTAATA